MSDDPSAVEPGTGAASDDQPWPPVDVSPAGLHVVGTRPFIGGVLQRLAPGSTLGEVTVGELEVGTTTRLKLRVEHDGPASVPRGWFVKMPSLDWRARAIGAVPQLLRSEAKFYRQLAGHLPVALPTCLATGIAWRGACVILSDLDGDGVVTGRPGDALDVERVGQVVDALAALHAAFMDSPVLDGPLRWMGEVRWRRESRFGRWLAGPILRAGLRAAASLDLPSGLVTEVARYAAGRHRALPLLRREARTLVHHDCHPGNLWFRAGTAGLLDWQMARVGDGVGDLAYLLATALEPALRRAAEMTLLDRYVAGLQAHGVAASSEVVFERYRSHLAYPLEAALATLGIGGLMDEAAALAYVNRTAAAACDHDAIARLMSLPR